MENRAFFAAEKQRLTKGAREAEKKSRGFIFKKINILWKTSEKNKKNLLAVMKKVVFLQPRLTRKELFERLKKADVTQLVE